MRRALSLAVGVALSIAAAAHAADPPFVTVGGGVGTFPIMAAKIADVINKEFPGVKASSIPGGSDLNLKNIQSGASTVGLSISMTTYQAYNGLAHFPQKLDKVRHVMSLYRGYVHYVASARSDIRSFEDITKRPYRVYVGKVGTLHHVLMNEMLKAYGITADTIRQAGGIPNPVAYSDVVRMLQDGQIDVAMLTGPVPYGLAMELAQSPGIRLLQASDGAVNKVAKALPGIGRAVIPKGRSFLRAASRIRSHRASTPGVRANVVQESAPAPDEPSAGPPARSRLRFCSSSVASSYQVCAPKDGLGVSRCR